MVRFERSKEIEKYVFRFVRSEGQKKILSPREESNLKHSV